MSYMLRPIQSQDSFVFDQATGELIGVWAINGREYKTLNNLTTVETAAVRSLVTTTMPNAVSGGLTDSYAAFQSVIDEVAASGGGRIRPARGRYLFGTQLRLRPGITLDLSEGVTLLRGFNNSANGAGLIGTTGTGADIAIIGGILDNQGQTYDTPANILSAVGIENLRIFGTKFLSVVDFHAIDINGCSNVRILDCGFHGFYNKSGTRQFSEAIQLDNQGSTRNSNVQVRGSKFGAALDASLTNFGTWPCALGNHSGIDGVYQDDIGFTDNSVTGASWAGLNLLNMRDVAVTSNRFTGCLHWVRLRPLDTVAPMQGCEGITITGNTGRTTSGAAVKFAAPTTENIANAATGRHKGVTITGNASDGGGIHFADITFASRVTVGGNTGKDSTYGCSVRFSDHITIAPNDFSGLGETAVWINEEVETALAGLGLTSDITINGGTYAELGYRGVHVNCAAKRVRINNPTITDPSTAAPTREGIRVDSGADDVTITGATVGFSGTVHSPFGISVAAGCTNVRVRANNSTGSTHGYEILAASTVLDIEGAATPESVFSAAVGSRYMRTDGGATTTLYIKTSGTGNTGWTGK